MWVEAEASQILLVWSLPCDMICPRQYSDKHHHHLFLRADAVPQACSARVDLASGLYAVD